MLKMRFLLNNNKSSLGTSVARSKYTLTYTIPTARFIRTTQGHVLAFLTHSVLSVMEYLCNSSQTDRQT